MNIASRLSGFVRTSVSTVVAAGCCIATSVHLEAKPVNSVVTSRVIYVSPDGNDAAAGTAEAPRQSVQRALDDAGPGDVVRLLPGVHRERVSFTHGGTYGRPVVLEGTDGAVIDGSEPVTLHWEPANDVAQGTYRAAVPFNPRTIIVDGKLLLILNEPRVTGDGPVDEQWRWQNIFRNGVRDRWAGVRGIGFYQSDTKQLLVRFENNRDPREMDFRLTPEAPVIHIDGADRCVVRNLEIRNALDGVRIENSTGSVVEHCKIGPADNGVWMDEGADRCTVRFNTITRNPLSVYNNETPELNEFSWDTWLVEKRAGFWGGQGVLMRRTEGGHQVHDNYIHDHWDGIQDRHWERVQTPPDVRVELGRYNQDLNIHHNRIELTNDDALEPNGAEINCQWHDNVMINTRCGLRVKTVDVGPMYIYGNMFLNNREDIRFFGSLELNPAEVYIYHNSSTARAAITSNKVHSIGTPNYHVYNNLFWVRQWWHNNGGSVDPNWTADHNVFVRWGDDERWSEMRKVSEAMGLDRHSRWLEDADAPYADVADGDLSLTPDSPARQAGADLAALLGRSLPGLDEHPGTRPDAGALPYGKPMPTIPRDPSTVEVIPAGLWPEAD